VSQCLLVMRMGSGVHSCEQHIIRVQTVGLAKSRGRGQPLRGIKVPSWGVELVRYSSTNFNFPQVPLVG
jgi:hypothetical protein